MKRTVLLVLLSLFISCVSSAQERKPWVMRTIKKLGTFIDSMAVRGIDQRYLEIPKSPWQVMLKYHMNDMDLRSTVSMSEDYTDESGFHDSELNVESAINPHTVSSIGVWMGYRGYGLGYNLSLTGKNASNFSIGATGSNYGLNLRIRKVNTNKLDIYLWGHADDEKIEMDMKHSETWDDIKVKTVIFDGYYMLNKKRFSYSAAYDQSVIQKRSAGSLMFGALWYQTSLDYSNRFNALFIQALANIGRIKIHEGAIGVGYSYNWVPVKNLLINITAMPMLVVYNRAKVYLYDSNYDLFLDEGEVSPTGKKPVPAHEEDKDHPSWMKDITLEEVGTDVKYGKLSLNLDARMSLTYNLGRYILNVNGQLNRFHNSIDENTLKLSDWYINALLGIRL